MPTTNAATINTTVLELSMLKHFREVTDPELRKLRSLLFYLASSTIRWTSPYSRALHIDGKSDNYKRPDTPPVTNTPGVIMENALAACS